MFGIKRNSEFFNRSGLLNISVHVPQRPGARIADLWPILNALIKALDKKSLACSDHQTIMCEVITASIYILCVDVVVAIPKS
jgi:hypothetical protein